MLVVRYGIPQIENFKTDTNTDTANQWNKIPIPIPIPENNISIDRYGMVAVRYCGMRNAVCGIFLHP